MTRRKTHEEFEEEVETLVGGEYTVVGKYVNAKTKIEILHNHCGQSWQVRPTKFLNEDVRCPKCAIESRRKSHSEFVTDISIKLGITYDFLTCYTGADKPITIKCKICGEVTVQNHASMLYRRLGCRNCSRLKRAATKTKSHTQFVRELNNVKGTGEYLVLSEYVRYNEKVKIKHLKCGTYFSSTPSDLISGNKGCPGCRQSKGEISISRFLKERSIIYSIEHSFEGCKDKHKLLFDFIIPSTGGKPIVIEYDGVQHFNPIDFFGGEEGLRETQRRDAIKDKYCADNGIPLIRIPYWDFDNIDEILTQKLVPLLEKRAI